MLFFTIMGFVFLYVTTASQKEAKTIAKALIGKKLIACANLFPMTSLYRWKGNVVWGKEVVLLCKTTTSLSGRAKREIEHLHSHDVPCVAIIPVTPNKKYAEWMKKVLSTKER